MELCGCFVSAGMCADFSIHDRQDGNPHAHIMLTMRPLEQSGEWGAKCRKEYILDKDGNRIRKADGAAFLRKNSIESIQELQETASGLWSQCRHVTEQGKQVESRLRERQEMIRQAHVYRENRECYVQYKKTKPRRQADFAERHRTELALYSYAERYLTEHTADRKVTLGAWQADAARLASEKGRLYDEMCGLRDKAKEASAVMWSVKRVMQPEQPQRRQVKKRGMEL